MDEQACSEFQASAMSLVLWQFADNFRKLVRASILRSLINIISCLFKLPSFRLGITFMVEDIYLSNRS